ncbi:recombinase family protein [Apilactobacillus micheneri]|uniref:Recombinase family protein n=1 Tax=Apilactobacillus micheneri TaxID=1899430 RepID=A0ABY2Z2V0_9LACO|nr:recombinase family protein [Apilactobacillus micheneri]TPR26246.1 recombinase family protein [Apilactobacillus micheneri]TPR27000.1 recombinase family protein [Apilactobacillus micheneri]TPR27858.1 recombinase family protein [Apilactobacillus micheneri]TPR31763.1 recombinase family protein [Apilactobacillus micheneri]TPR32167.1 recombinase family protein [Apilactobacillus micheneri]
MTKNAILYTRCSTKKQVASFSLEHQTNLLINYINDNALNKFGLYTDSGISGKSMNNRRGIMKLIDAIKKDSNNIDYLITESFDRLSRSKKDLVDIFDLCERMGVTIISVLTPIHNLNYPQRKMMATMYAIFSEMKIDTTSEAVKKSFEQQFNSKGLISSKLPFGYYLDKDANIVIEENAKKLVCHIFHLYLAGYGYRSILNKLYMSGKTNFTIQRIKNILTNTRYKGVMVTNYGTRDDVFPVIIPMNEFNKVQMKIASKSTKILKNKFNNDGFFHKIICPICGNYLGVNAVKSSKKTYFYYYCSTGRNKPTNDKNHHNFSLKMNQFKSLLVDYIKSFLDSRVFKNKLINLLSNFIKDDLAVINSKYNNQKRKIVNQYKINKINQKELKSELKTIGKKDSYFDDIRLKLNKFYELGINGFLKDLVSQVTIDKGKYIFRMYENSVVIGKGVMNND